MANAPEKLCEDTDLLFEELPCAVLVLTEDLRLMTFNRAAFRVMSQGADELLGLLTGDVIGCVHASEPPAGCGTTPSCRQCVLRNSVEETLRTGQNVCAIAPMTLRGRDTTTDVRFFLATSRVPGEAVALVTLQDMSYLRAATAPDCVHIRKT